MNDTLKATEQWFDIARPEANARTFQVQFAVHCEEVAETLEALSVDDAHLDALLANAVDALEELSEYLKKDGEVLTIADVLRVPFLDGLSDTIVTSVGCAQALNMDIVGAMGEVNRSNFSKYENGKPVFKENGKIGKGKDYTPPDLTPFIIR